MIGCENAPKELLRLLLAAGVDADRRGAPIVYAGENSAWHARACEANTWMVDEAALCRVNGVWVKMAPLLVRPETLAARDLQVFRECFELGADAGCTGLQACAKAAMEGDTQAAKVCWSHYWANEFLGEWYESQQRQGDNSNG